MLPDILSVAKDHRLEINERTFGKKEVLAKCPFCLADANRKNKFYLSLNTEDKVFKCWFCGESGGVIRFIALLEGVPENEVLRRYNLQRKKRHPAVRLTSRQLKLAGFRGKADWQAMKERNPDYYQATLDFVWAHWNDFLEREKRMAFCTLVEGIHFLQYKEAVDKIREREREIGYPLLRDVLLAYSLPDRPAWAVIGEQMARKKIELTKAILKHVPERKADA
jgi:hypothetical protein